LGGVLSAAVHPRSGIISLLLSKLLAHSNVSSNLRSHLFAPLVDKPSLPQQSYSPCGRFEFASTLCAL